MKCPACGMIFTPKSKVRTNPQNRYYYGCIIPTIGNELGYTNKEMHEILAGMFLSEVREVGDTSVTVIHSTADLTTVEFEEYAKECREWASKDNGKPRIWCPMPNEADCV